MIFRYVFAALLVVGGLTGSVFAGEYGDLKFYNTKGNFNDVKENVEDAIINRGFVIDYHGFIGNMLKRTGKDIGSTKALYKDAQFYQFCSASLSRKTMEADPRNIGYCPYVVVVYELASTPDTVHVGYRHLGMGGSEESKKALAAVDKVLDEIAREAAQ
ncbi:MAG: DUF302 domain-containing protein [Rhodospirillales bacterium]|nr:DUF302 domain-containing protein [Rhodospirillales bacterium]